MRRQRPRSTKSPYSDTPTGTTATSTIMVSNTTTPVIWIGTTPGTRNELRAAALPHAVARRQTDGPGCRRLQNCNGQGLLSYPIRITIEPITIERARRLKNLDVRPNALAGSGAAPVGPPPETARKLLRRFGFGG